MKNLPAKQLREILDKLTEATKEEQRLSRKGEITHPSYFMMVQTGLLAFDELVAIMERFENSEDDEPSEEERVHAIRS